MKSLIPFREAARSRDGRLRVSSAPASLNFRRQLKPIFTRRSHIVILALSSLFFALVLAPSAALGNCSLTSTGKIPLPDLGPGLYQGFQGGLYPGGSNTRPSAHEAAGIAAANQIVPLNASGIPDTGGRGKIGLVSIGLSNTTDEFGSGGSNAFKPRADADPSKNPTLTLVDGAQAGKDAAQWANPNDDAWTTLSQRLGAAGISAAQVEAVWLKLALETPANYGAFPAHAQILQNDLEIILRTLKSRYPNLRIVFFSSRTRAFTDNASDLNPEPFAYESGFSVQWTIADQINGNGNLNFDPAKGAVVAPYLTWGPYLWADGTRSRSDGFTWLCEDLQTDFIHPSSSGVGKVADQLLAFFKTDPTATPWFLKRDTGSALTLTASAVPAFGPAGLTTQFNASATGAPVASYEWTYDDGTFSNAQNPVKTFPVTGTYNVHLTVTANTGDYLTKDIPVTVGPGVDSLQNVSARLQVGVADHVGISGFIVGGNGTKRVLLRAIGPSLAPLGIAGPLANPYLELHDASGASVASNDNWQTTQIAGLITGDQVAAIRDSMIAPTHPAESALIVDLGAGAYTAVIRGTNGEIGVGLAEVYDLDPVAPATVSNLSTRGSVETGNNVLIGGFIVGGSSPSEIVVRAIGPSLTLAGVPDALVDPTLELRDANGALLASNDNWADTQQGVLQASGLAPSDTREAAIEQSLTPGSYTATVAGKDGAIGVGLVEVYRLP